MKCPFSLNRNEATGYTPHVLTAAKNTKTLIGKGCIENALHGAQNERIR